MARHLIGRAITPRVVGQPCPECLGHHALISGHVDAFGVLMLHEPALAALLLELDDLFAD